MEFSEVAEDTSFIVLGSQTEESELPDPGEIYQRLEALHHNYEMVNDGSRLKLHQNGGGRKVPNGEGEANNNGGSASQEPVPPVGDGGEPPVQIPQPGGSGGGAAGGGGGGHDGDDNPDFGAGNPDVSDDSEEENSEETTTSENSEMPSLIKAGEQGQAGQSGKDAHPYPDVKPHYYGSSESDMGGISDAPTTVVSDTDGEGQKEQKGTQGKKVRLLSSDTSSLSNPTGSSESDLDVTVKLRPSGSARIRQQPRRLQILSTQEMAEREENEEVESAREEAEDDDHIVLTPAEHLASLQFSGQTSNMLDSMADDSDVVPPSQEYEIPMMVPSYPTATGGPTVGYRSPRSRRLLRYPSLSPRRHKQLIGARTRTDQSKNEPDPGQVETSASSSFDTTGQPQQWAPSASLNVTSSSFQSGRGSGGSDSVIEQQNVPSSSTGVSEKEKKERAEEEATEEEDADVTQSSSVQMVCPMHGVKQEKDDAASQDFVLQLSQSQGILHSSVASSAPRTQGAMTSEVEQLQGAQSEQFLERSHPPTSSLGDPSIATDTEASFEHETESPSQPRFTFDRPTFEEVPEGSEKEKTYSVFKKAIRQRRETKLPDSSSSDDPFVFQSEPSELPETSKGISGKRKADHRGGSSKSSKRVRIETPEHGQEKSEKSVPIDFGADTLEYEYTGLRPQEAESMRSLSKTTGEASTSTPQEAMRSIVMDTGSSEEIAKEGDVTPADRLTTEDPPARLSPITNSAPESRARVSQRPLRPSGAHSAGEASGRATKTARLQEVRALRDNNRRRWQALQQPEMAHSPQMARFMASQPEHQDQEPEYRKVRQMLTTIYRKFPSGVLKTLYHRADLVDITDFSDLSSEDMETTSPVSSKSSHPSIASGELADISSLSRSSGDHSSGSFTKPSIPTVKKKSPSSSSSYEPSRQSIGEYLKRMSTISSIPGEEVPIRRRTISAEDNPDVGAPRPSTSAQADVSSDPAGSVAPSEALFSSPPSIKTDSSINRTSSTSCSSLPCAQPTSTATKTSDSSTATTSGMSLVLSPTRVSFSSSDAATWSHRDRAAKESFESSRSRSSSGGKSIPLFSDTFSSHHSSETSRRSDDGLFRVPSVPIRTDKAKQRASLETQAVEQVAEEAAEVTIVEEEEEESLTPQAGEDGAEPKGSPREGQGTKSKPVEPKEEKSTSSAAPVTQETEEAPVTVPVNTGDGEDRGYPVYAQWRDKYFYPGHIIGEERGGRYKVRFEDGDSMQVKEGDIILVDLLMPGQEVFAEKTECNEIATVVDHVDLGYLVKFNDEFEARLERGKVIMSPEQAKDFVRLSHGKPGYGTPVQGAADVSLENLVMGKRQRGGSTPSTSKETTAGNRVRGSTPGRTAKSGSTSSKKGSTAKKGRGRPPKAKSPSRRVVAKEEDQPEDQPKQELEEEAAAEIAQISDISGIEVVEESGEKRRGRKTKRKLIVEPKATSTPTPQKRRARVVSHEELAEPLSPLRGKGRSPPAAVEKSPKKSRYENVKGPVPPQGSVLFEGMKFLLTHCEKLDAQKPGRGRPSDSNTDESSLYDDEGEIPFDKDCLTTQIETGSGTIMETFQLADVTDRCYCISDSYQRTLKYLHCLAANVVCVSHVWIHNCCSANRVLDYKAYVLPAGLNIERKTLVEQNIKNRPFLGKTVLISSENTKFQKTWTEVLASAGCKIINKIPSKPACKDVLVAVADVSTSASVVTRLNNSKITIVSSEWVIQSIIAGHCAIVDRHPRYAHDYEPPEKSL